MPLNWNISNSEMGKIRDTNPEDKRNCDDGFIQAVGLSVLNETIGSYTYSLDRQTLTQELMEKLREEYLKDLPKISTPLTEGNLTWKITTWFPLLVGSTFIRTH